MAEVSRYAVKVVASLPGVKVARRAAAEALGQEARANLRAHRETGASRIVVRHRTRDSFVELVDAAALSIEFGRGGYTRRDGKRIGPAEGLHILGRLL
jgi:hypothetical protein